MQVPRSSETVKPNAIWNKVDKIHEVAEESKDPELSNRNSATSSLKTDKSASIPSEIMRNDANGKLASADKYGHKEE